MKIDKEELLKTLIVILCALAIVLTSLFIVEMAGLIWWML